MCNNKIRHKYFAPVASDKNLQNTPTGLKGMPNEKNEKTVPIIIKPNVNTKPWIILNRNENIF